MHCEAQADLQIDAYPDVVIRDMPATYRSDIGAPSFDAKIITRIEAMLRQLPTVESYQRLSLSAYYGSGTHPRVLKVEPTTFCNLKCTFCPNPSLEARHRLTADQFFRLWHTVDPTKLLKVSFTGLGEATLNRDLWTMIKCVSETGTPTSLVTNGKRLALDARHIVESGLTDLAVSIETLNPDEYAAQRVGSDVETVLANIDVLRRVIAASNSPLRLNILSVMPGGLSEGVQSLLNYCAENDLPAPRFYPIYDRFDTARPPRNPMSDLQERMAELGKRAEALGLEITSPRELNLMQRGASGDRHLDIACLEPNSVFVARANGSWACCNEAIFSSAVVGGRVGGDTNVQGEWQGDALRSFRLALASGSPREICRGCSAFEIPAALALSMP